MFADLIKFPYYVIDFVILPDWSAKVIEINPFVCDLISRLMLQGAMTGGPLFNYHLYTDRWTLQGGEDLWGDLEDLKSKQNENDNSLSSVEFPVVRLLKTPHPQITYEYVYGYFGFDLQYFDKKFNNASKNNNNNNDNDKQKTRTKSKSGCTVS